MYKTSTNNDAELRVEDVEATDWEVFYYQYEVKETLYDKRYKHVDEEVCISGVKEALKEYLQRLSRDLELVNIKGKIDSPDLLKEDFFKVVRIWELAKEVFGEELIK